MGEIGGVRVTLLPDSVLIREVTAGPGWHSLGYRCRARSAEIAPVGRTWEPGRTAGKPHGGTHLKDTMVVEFDYADPRILVGSRDTVGDEGLALLALVELGTEAHPIDPVNANALRFVDRGTSGTIVFAAHVTHPGTKKNPFVERAMQQVVHESGGAAFR